MTTPNGTTRPRDHLFVCGVARSGTTALARCLNRHRRVVLGIERFRRALIASSAADCGGLFEKDRFFDFRRSDNAAYTAAAARLAGEQEATVNGGRFAPASGWPRRLYDDAREKYDNALYVGDKIPVLYRRAQFLRETFTDCKLVFLVRAPVAVGMSWQMRADNPASPWPRRNGFAEAIAEWNDALKTTMLAKAILGHDLIVVLFEGMFADDGLRRLLSRLDLDGGEMGEIGDLVKVWKRAVRRDAAASSAQAQYVEEHIDHGIYEWFKKEAEI